jgi:hypothetical protein
MDDLLIRNGHVVDGSGARGHDAVASALGGPASDNGRLCHGDGATKGDPAPESVDVGHPLDLHQLRSLTARPEA